MILIFYMEKKNLVSKYSDSVEILSDYTKLPSVTRYSKGLKLE